MLLPVRRPPCLLARDISFATLNEHQAFAKLYPVCTSESASLDRGHKFCCSKFAAGVWRYMSLWLCDIPLSPYMVVPPASGHRQPQGIALKSKLSKVLIASLYETQALPSLEPGASTPCHHAPTAEPSIDMRRRPLSPAWSLAFKV